MKVVVLGAGVIGVTSAYFLARAGHQVTVLEKASSSAMGCSYANGGQLSYSHVETWAGKESFSSILKAAFAPRSFLSISKISDKEFWKWFFRFYKNSSVETSHKNSAKLFAISSYSRDVLKEILKEEKDLKFNYQDNGILHFYRTQKKFDAAIKSFESYGFLGRKAQILSADECIKKEPTLVKLFDEKKLAGGIFYEIDSSGDSFLFTRALEKICKEKYGVTFEYDVEVKNILTNYQKITGINTSKGVFAANNYVYALGAYGCKLLRGIGIETQIYPLKGYSLSIASDEEFVAPNLALTDAENKIVYSRIGKTFRAAGSVEISRLSPNKNKKNIKFLKTVICASFSDFGNFNDLKEWFGFRPFRPNSLPLICEVKKYGNLYLNTGHGSLGWTLSAASGKILSDLTLGKKRDEFRFLEEEEEGVYGG